MKNRKPFFVPLLFGILALTAIATDPHFSTCRAVDMLRLVGAGMCLGVALMFLFKFRR